MQCIGAFGIRNSIKRPFTSTKPRIFTQSPPFMDCILIDVLNNAWDSVKIKIWYSIQVPGVDVEMKLSLCKNYNNNRNRVEAPQAILSIRNLTVLWFLLRQIFNWILNANRQYIRLVSISVRTLCLNGYLRRGHLVEGSTSAHVYDRS